jgi:ribosomal protein S21
MINRKISEFDPSRVTGIEVKVEGSGREDFEHAFRKFKALAQKERIVGEYKEHMAYEKPSEKKRRKSRESIERNRLNALREKMILSGEWDKRQKRKAEQKSKKSGGENG